MQEWGGGGIVSLSGRFFMAVFHGHILAGRRQGVTEIGHTSGEYAKKLLPP